MRAKIAGVVNGIDQFMAWLIRTYQCSALLEADTIPLTPLSHRIVENLRLNSDRLAAELAEKLEASK